MPTMPVTRFRCPLKRGGGRTIHISSVPSNSKWYAPNRPQRFTRRRNCTIRAVVARGAFYGRARHAACDNGQGMMARLNVSVARCAVATCSSALRTSYGHSGAGVTLAMLSSELQAIRQYRSSLFLHPLNHHAHGTMHNGTGRRAVSIRTHTGGDGDMAVRGHRTNHREHPMYRPEYHGCHRDVAPCAAAACN